MNCLIKVRASSPSFQTALINGQTAFSYAQIDQLVDKLAGFLFHKGIRPQMTIPFLAKYHFLTPLFFFAAFRLGAIACPINFRLPSLLITEYIKQLGAKEFFDPEQVKLTNFQDYERNFHPQKPAIYLQTSGSTGKPKICVLSYANFYYSALGILPFMNLKEGDLYLFSLPAHHVGGISIFFRTFASGATLAMPEKNIFQQIAKTKITHASFVPTQIFRCFKSNSLSLDSLKCVLIGGSAMRREVKKWITKKNYPFFFSYGMTEMASTVTLGTAFFNGLGTTLPYRELKIDQSNQILVKGKTLFLGYLKKGKLQLELDQNGWFNTKDIGSLIPDVGLIFQGRKDRMFICGGENIHPEEIEAALYQLQEVKEAYVIGMNDPEYGSRPIAFIRTVSFTFEEREILAKLREFLPALKLPVRLFPLSSAYSQQNHIKISYFSLEKMARKLLGREILL